MTFHSSEIVEDYMINPTGFAVNDYISDCIMIS